MIRSLETAQSDLALVLGRMRNALQRGLQRFIRDYAAVRPNMSLRSIANNIHDCLRMEILLEFPKGNPDGVRPMQVNGNLFVIMVHDKYRFRLKKLTGDKLRTANVQTEAVLDFARQRDPLELLPSPTNVYLGYRQKSPAELLTSEIWLTCPDGGAKPRWTMEVLEASGGSTSSIEKKTTRKRRVKPRRDVGEAEGTVEQREAEDGKDGGK
jgi:hypothetical protein